MERTFAMVKPDGVQRGLAGELIHRFERKGFKLVAAKLMRISRELAEKHYGEHRGKPFFTKLVDFIISGPVLAMVLEGEDAVAQVRAMMGATDPKKSGPGTMRADFGMSMARNIIHGSDSVESAKREISLFFTIGELLDYGKVDEGWLYEK
jgi:nucleoside-diphosphate kinase